MRDEACLVVEGRCATGLGVRFVRIMRREKGQPKMKLTSSHLNGFSPVCVLRWICRLLLAVKLFSQKVHL